MVQTPSGQWMTTVPARSKKLGTGIEVGAHPEVQRLTSRLSLRSRVRGERLPRDPDPECRRGLLGLPSV